MNAEILKDIAQADTEAAEQTLARIGQNLDRQTQAGMQDDDAGAGA